MFCDVFGLQIPGERGQTLANLSIWGYRLTGTRMVVHSVRWQGSYY